MTTDPKSIFSGSTLKLAAGQKLAGCYSLERPIEVGGGHLIWIAQDEVLGKQVSIHFLPPPVTRDAAAIEALRHEVKRNRPLIHPGVLRVYDLVEGDDWTAVAMESFEARCLADLLREKGRFEIADVEPWLDQVCVTLEEAHRIKLFHRDLSPENIFVTSAGRLLMANFGLSRIVQDSLERAGASAGVAVHQHTLSPELLGGASPAATDDVYGVGTLFFELLAGQPIFSGGDLASKIRQTIPPRLSEIRAGASDPGKEIPGGWDNVIAACLNKHADERPNRPSEIVSSIEAYLPSVEPVPVSAVQATSFEEKETPTEAEIKPAEIVAEVHSEPSLLPIPESPKPLARSETLESVEPAAVEVKPVAKEEEAAPATIEPDPISATLPVLVKPEPDAPKVAAPAPAPQKSPNPFTPRPVKYYDTEEDAFSAILPRRFRFPAAVAAAVILLLLLVNGFFKNPKEKTTAPVIATTDSADRSELTSVKNSLGQTSETPGKVSPELPPTSVSTPPPEPAAVQKAPAKPDLIVAAGPTPSLPPGLPRAAAAPGSASPTEKEIADKAAAVERLKQELAKTETEQQGLLKEQQTSASAVAEVQKAIDDKMKAAASAKKVTEDLLATRKKREEDQKATEAAARAAQQLAAEKVRAAEDARKALTDFEAQNREKLAAQDKVDAEIQTLQQTLADRQKAAEANAKSATAAETTRKQLLSALQQTEQELTQAKASIAQVSADEERRRQAADSERKKLDDELAAMRALFEQKMKDIEDRRRQIESAPAAPGAPTAKASVPQTVEIKQLPVATPAPTLPLMAKIEIPRPPAPPPTPDVIAPAPAAASGGTNSLGLRFTNVGDVQFAVWQTRVKDFETFAKSVALKSTAWRGPGFRQGPDHPVVNVTWTEAIAFCKWLTDKEHKEGTLPANQFYRLPYDLEWSKAVGLPDESGKTPEARDMGVPDVYPWGTDWPPPKGAGNYTGEETGSDVAIKGYDDGFAWTAPVGSFPPNKLGLYDMGGNVWQWCMDSWNNESKAKVLRGASWYNGALKLSLLSSCRVHASADSSTDNYGFRIVRATETTSAKSAKR